MLGAAETATNLDFDRISEVAKAVKAVMDKGFEVGIVVGAGNIFRARMIRNGEVERVAADHMGMMATIINSLALQSGFEHLGIDARVLSAIPMPEVMENYVHKRAINHLRNHRVAIFAGGTGRPYFSTDTAAVIRGLEVKADVVLKATDVDGVYDDNPHINRGAKKFDTITFADALERRLEVMDGTALALAQENNLPIIVFKFSPENLLAVVSGKKVGTLVSS